MQTSLVLLVLACGATVGGAAQPKAPKKLPPFDAVKAAAHQVIAKQPGYRANDILSREQVVAALNAVEKTSGWEIEDRKPIAAAFLAEGDFLVRQLRTPRGTLFMRRFSGTPLAYDRIDRLRSLPNGSRRIPELINNPGGHTLILYMATTPGGRNMGRYLNETPGVKNFNQPTRRLYTEAQLLERLKLSYTQELKYRQFGRPKQRKAQ